MDEEKFILLPSDLPITDYKNVPTHIIDGKEYYIYDREKGEWIDG